jgi:hypothetical protein
LSACACETFLNLGTRKSQTPNGPTVVSLASISV